MQKSKRGLGHSMRSHPRAAKASRERRMTGGNRQDGSLAGSCMAFGRKGGAAAERKGFRSFARAHCCVFARAFALPESKEAQVGFRIVASEL